jgi:putative endonuclease
MYCVYLLLCADGSIYTGITNDLEKRLARHKDGTASRYTRARGALRILYTEQQLDRSSALRREAEIKKWSRARKLSLIPGYTARMAQGSNAGVRQKKARPHKTAKRLEAKKLMLAAKHRRKGRSSHSIH